MCLEVLRLGVGGWLRRLLRKVLRWFVGVVLDKTEGELIC